MSPASPLYPCGLKQGDEARPQRMDDGLSEVVPRTAGARALTPDHTPLAPPDWSCLHLLLPTSEPSPLSAGPWGLALSSLSW